MTDPTANTQPAVAQTALSLVKKTPGAVLKAVPRVIDTSSNAYGFFLIPIYAGFIRHGPWLFVPVLGLGALSSLLYRPRAEKALHLFNDVAESAALVAIAVGRMAETLNEWRHDEEDLKRDEAVFVVALTVAIVGWKYYVKHLRKNAPHHRLDKIRYTINLVMGPIEYVAAFDTILAVFSEGFEWISEDVQLIAWCTLFVGGFGNEIVRRIKPGISHYVDQVVELGFELSIPAFFFSLLNDIAVVFNNYVHDHHDSDDLPAWYLLLVSLPLTLAFTVYQTIHFFHQNAHEQHAATDGEVTPLLEASSTDASSEDSSGCLPALRGLFGRGQRASVDPEQAVHDSASATPDAEKELVTNAFAN